MVKLTAAGLALVLLAELTLAGPLREWLLAVTGVVLAVVLGALVASLGDNRAAEPVAGSGSGPAESLERWLSRTETLVSWADGSRGDWDRHLRPILALEFQMSSGHRQSRDRAALHAAGLVLFGNTLWPWVDPMGSVWERRNEPGPGTATLNEILTRMERL